MTESMQFLCSDLKKYTRGYKLWLHDLQVAHVVQKHVLFICMCVCAEIRGPLVCS